MSLCFTQQLYFYQYFLLIAKNNQQFYSFGLLYAPSLTGVRMKIEDLEKHATCYKIAKLLGVTPTSVYQWKRTGKIPPLRIYQLKEMKPEWFPKEQ
jgi:DNA-binding transcriptional regulator Cro